MKTGKQELMEQYKIDIDYYDTKYSMENMTPPNGVMLGIKDMNIIVSYDSSRSRLANEDFAFILLVDKIVDFEFKKKQEKFKRMNDLTQIVCVGCLIGYLIFLLLKNT